MIKQTEDISHDLQQTVTLGVCVRNCGKYIKEALESIADQDYPHSLMNIIFVDGCSKDDTLSIIREWSSKIDIKVQVFSDYGMGLGHARNVVVANARSDFVLWVDGDMFLSKDFVTELVAFMQDNPEVGVTKGRQGYGSGGNLVGRLEEYSRVAGHMVDYGSAEGRSKALGTSGCIYRIEVFKDAGSFDEHMRGYGEDQDIELRVRAAGWLLEAIDVEYLDYERHGITWSDLWRRYWLRGYYTHCFLHKHKGMVKHYRIFPPSAFISGLLQSLSLYKLSFRKSVFLLPLQYLFKMTAWYFGYVRSHTSSYEPENRLYFPELAVK